MEPAPSLAARARQLVARFMKTAIVVCWVFMAGTVIALVVASRFSPAALAAIIAAIACMAGVFVVLYQSAGKWARDPDYSLRGKELALLFALSVASLLLIFWSTSL
jgi:hypothetical protein